MARPQCDIREAVRRVAGEEYLPLAWFVPQTALVIHGKRHTPGVGTLTRWIVEGLRGVHLDAFHRPGAGWMTSAAALDRFAAAVPPAGERAQADPLSRVRRADLERLSVGLWAVLLAVGGTLLAPSPTEQSRTAA